MGKLTPEEDPVAQGVAAVLVVLEKRNHDGKHAQCKPDSLDCPGHGWRYVSLQLSELLASFVCTYYDKAGCLFGTARATANRSWQNPSIFVSAGYNCCFFTGGQRLILFFPCMRLHQIMMNIISLHQQSTLLTDGIDSFASSYPLPGEQLSKAPSAPSVGCMVRAVPCPHRANQPQVHGKTSVIGARTPSTII